MCRQQALGPIPLEVSSAPEGPYHSVRILTSFGFEQTGDNEKYPLDLMRRVLS